MTRNYIPHIDKDYILTRPEFAKLVGLSTNALRMRMRRGQYSEYYVRKNNYYLFKRPGVIKERAHLMDIAYKENTDIEDRTIDSHIKRIRKKFKKVDDKFSSIETRYGSGYRWNVN